MRTFDYNLTLLNGIFHHGQVIARNSAAAFEVALRHSGVDESSLAEATLRPLKQEEEELLSVEMVVPAGTYYKVQASRSGSKLPVFYISAAGIANKQHAASNARSVLGFRQPLDTASEHI